MPKPLSPPNLDSPVHMTVILGGVRGLKKVLRLEALRKNCKTERLKKKISQIFIIWRNPESPPTLSVSASIHRPSQSVLMLLILMPPGYADIWVPFPEKLLNMPGTFAAATCLTGIYVLFSRGRHFF